MDLYGACAQTAPSGRLYYTCYDESEQAKLIADASLYAMYASFKHGEYSSQLRGAYDYGKRTWDNPFRVLHMTILPDKLVDVIRMPAPKAVNCSTGSVLC